MSVQAITYVLDHSEAKGSDRLVLIALANHACTEKGECWPSVRLLACEARVSERTVQYALRSLEFSGRVKRLKAPGQNGTVRRRLVFDAATEKDRPSLPKEGADPAPPEVPAENPPGAGPAPGADSAGVQPATSGGANDDTPGVQTSAPEPSRGTVREPSAAANAAAAGAPAGSGSSTGHVRDVADEFYDRAADALVTSGFTPAEVSTDRLRVRTELRKHGADLGRVDWDKLAAQLQAGRADGSIFAPTPVGVMAFGLRQLGAGHLIGDPARPPRAQGPSPAPAGSINDRLEIVGSEAANQAWRELVDGLEQTKFWAEKGRDAYAQWLPTVIPVRLADGVLEITAANHAVGWIEANVLPTLDRYARERLNGRVRWLDRPAAAALPTSTNRTAA